MKINYFNKKNYFYHGIMFHHIHDNKRYKPGQGSISIKEFEKIIRFVRRKNILDAQDFIHKLTSRKLKSKHICLTFDDALKSQIDLIVPVLDKLKIKAFFFVYTEIFTNPKKQKLELYRYFRTNFFDDADTFNHEFLFLVKKKFNLDIDKIIKQKKLKIFGYSIKEWKIKFPYFSDADIKFRITRDNILSTKKYDQIMEIFFKKKKFDKSKILNKLFFSKNDLKKLVKKGHMIGLHSHTHPSQISKLSKNKQLFEYKKNKSILEKIIKKNVISMSHPCGSYNKMTIKILKKLDIELGFKQVMTLDKGMKKINQNPFEIARHDAPSILIQLNK